MPEILNLKEYIDYQEGFLEGGQMIIMPANEPHALKALERYKMMLVMIKSKF